MLIKDGFGYLSKFELLDNSVVEALDAAKVGSIANIANEFLDGRTTPPLSFTPFEIKGLTPDRRKFLTRPLESPTPKESYTGEPWYQAVEAKLEEVLNIDKQNAIEGYSEDLEDTTNIEMLEAAIQRLQECIDEQNITQPKPLLNLMKLLSERLFCGVERFFYGALNQVRSQWRELDLYMRDVPGQENEGPILKPAGVQKIIDFFIGEYNFPREMLSCQYLSSLPGLVRELISSGEEGRAVGWAICSDDESEKHVVPVFAIYRNGQAHIFVIDSEGHDVYPDQPKYKPFTRLHSSLQLLRRRDNLAGELQLYSFKKRRQTDNVSCTVLSLLDLKSLIELHLDGLDLIEYYRKHEGGAVAPKLIPSAAVDEEGDFGLPFYELSVLPPSMLKATQSYTRLKELQREKCLVDLSYNSVRTTSRGGTIVKNQNIETFFEEIDSYKFYTTEGEARNLYALSKRFSYIIYLIISVLEAKEEQSEDMFKADEKGGKQKRMKITDLDNLNIIF